MAELSDDDAVAVSSWLDRNQFLHVESIGGPTAAFGDQQDTWERDGTLVRLTQDRSQWWYDISRAGSKVWLDVGTVATAIGVKQTAPVERVDVLASAIDGRLFDTLASAKRHGP